MISTSFQAQKKPELSTNTGYNSPPAVGKLSNTLIKRLLKDLEGKLQ